MSFEDFADELNDDPVPTKGPAATGTKYPCGACGGTGIWRQRRANKHGDKHCFSCGGSGYFKTSPEARYKARAQRQARKVAKAEAAHEMNRSHDGLLDWLKANSDWNDFARSLVEQDTAGRQWSDAQVRAAQSMRAKTEAKRAAREQERAAERVAVDLEPIAEMFLAASQSGYKRPLYRAEGVRLKPGKGGSLYVLDDERTEPGHFGEQPMYLGKIEDGSFRPGRNGHGKVEFTVEPAEGETVADLIAGREDGTFTVDGNEVAVSQSVVQALGMIARSPKGAALAHGRRTGRCSCCGRELTKHASIEAGIGPICAEKWGL